MSKLKVTLVRSPIGLVSSHRRTCEALGLRKIRRTRIHEDNPVIRGMVRKVRHLVTVALVADDRVEEESSATA